MPNQNFIVLEYLKGRKDQIVRRCSSIPNTVGMDKDKTRNYVDVLLDLNGQIVRQRVQMDRIIRRKLPIVRSIPL